MLTHPRHPCPARVPEDWRWLAERLDRLIDMPDSTDTTQISASLLRIEGKLEVLMAGVAELEAKITELEVELGVINETTTEMAASNIEIAADVDALLAAVKDAVPAATFQRLSDKVEAVKGASVVLRTQADELKATAAKYPVV